LPEPSGPVARAVARPRPSWKPAITALTVAIFAILIIGTAAALLRGDLGTTVGGACVLAVAIVALILGGRHGGRIRLETDRLVQVLSPRVREHRSEGTEGGLLATFVLDNNLVLQTGDSSVVSFFSAYFANEATPVALTLSDVRRWHAGLGVFRRETRHMERRLGPLISAEVDSLLTRLVAKSARLDLHLPRHPRNADQASPSGMVRFIFDPRRYEGLPERLLSVLDSVRSLLERAWISAKPASPTRP
jgi:hypothetical protein